MRNNLLNFEFNFFLISRRAIKPCIIAAPYQGALNLAKRPLDKRGNVVEVPSSCDGAAKEGDALANMSVRAAHDSDGRADGGENRHDELNDVFDGFLLHGNRSPPLIPPKGWKPYQGLGLCVSVIG